MIRRTLLKLSPLVCLSLICAIAPVSLDAQDADKAGVAGVWDATAQTDQGERTSVWTIVKSGDAYEGEYISSDSDEKREITNISFDGKDFRFDMEIDGNGQALLIQVATKLDGGKLTGTWAATSEGNELASGTLTAVKKVAAKFSGKWNTIATLPDGEELTASMSLKGNNKKLSGSITSDGGETKIDKITAKSKTIRMEFVLDVEGDPRDVVIEASMDSEKSLEGSWILLDDTGSEEASGDWKAERAKPDKAAKPAQSDSNAGFDGSTIESFRGYNTEAIGSGWKMADGTLHLDGTKSGDIMTRQEFGNFELEFDWKISEGGNSGVMYRVSLGDKKPYLSGPEYQVLDDDKHKDGKLESHRSGSLYALYPPTNKTLKPVGQWNTSKIVLNGNAVEHWLNGNKVVEAELGSDDWNEKVAASKFKNWEKFGKNKKGHICFQDHGNPVWYRNIKVKSLD